MRKHKVTAVAIGLILGLLVAGVSYAGEIDLLLEKLVDKGVLSGAEAQQIKYETQEKVKKEIATGKSESMPAWIQNIKLKGDLRLRYQYKHEKATNDYSKDTHLGRVRARLGLESRINDKILAGIGIATNSGGDPRSTNISFGDKNGGFSSKFEVRLDYAYAMYDPLPWLRLTGGKMLLKDVLWEPTDLVWDTDITPEGGVVALNKNISDNLGVFMNTGVLVGTSDTSTNADPTMMYFFQPGVTYKFNSNVSLKGAISLSEWSTKNHPYPTDSWYKSSNTKSGSNWRYDYKVISPALELSIKEPFKAIGLNVESLKFMGEYVNNLAAPNKNTGFALGVRTGNEKIEKWGDWQLKYIYAMLGKDSVLDATPDSDRYSGKTGMRSHELELQYGLGKNTFLGVDVYRSWNIAGGAKAPETLVQIDWNMKF